MRSSQDVPNREPATVERLRREIDRGAARDKIAFPDPAIAPLGADAEAGGAPPNADEIRQSMPRRLSLDRDVSGGGWREQESLDGGAVLPWRSLILGALAFGLAGSLFVAMRFG